MIFRGGLLFPETVLQSGWFTVFATFVAINTIVYVVLSIAKLFPVVRFGGRRGGFNRRSESRSIYPERDAGGPSPERR